MNSLRLVINNQPPLTYQYEDKELVSFTVGEQQFTADELESDEGRAALAWLGKEVPYYRMKSFSDSLGRNGLYGGKGRCMLQLHMTLLSLYKGHGEEENDEGLTEDDESLVESNRTESDEAEESQREGKWWRRRRRRRR